MNKIKLILMIFASLVSVNVWAYLDPGTGSILVQVIMGGIAGLAAAGKLMWFRVKEFFGLGSVDDSKSPR